MLVDQGKNLYFHLEEKPLKMAGNGRQGSLTQPQATGCAWQRGRALTSSTSLLGTKISLGFVESFSADICKTTFQRIKSSPSLHQQGQKWFRWIETTIQRKMLLEATFWLRTSVAKSSVSLNRIQFFSFKKRKRTDRPPCDVTRILGTSATRRHLV